MLSLGFSKATTPSSSSPRWELTYLYHHSAQGASLFRPASSLCSVSSRPPPLREQEGRFKLKGDLMLITLFHQPVKMSICIVYKCLYMKPGSASHALLSFPRLHGNPLTPAAHSNISPPSPTLPLLLFSHPPLHPYTPLRRFLFAATPCISLIHLSLSLCHTLTYKYTLFLRPLSQSLLPPLLFFSTPVCLGKHLLLFPYSTSWLEHDNAHINSSISYGCAALIEVMASGTNCQYKGMAFFFLMFSFQNTWINQIYP